MTNRSIIKTVLMTLSLMLLCNLGAYAQKTDCSKTTDADLVEAIYAKLKPKYESQLSHINVRAENGVVTVEGFAVKEKDKKDIEKTAKKIKCVKSIVNNLKVGASGGCPPGAKPCGDICIGQSDTCNIRTKGGGN